jgi:fructoselysine-6-P-deglycase FrlB-like protein
MTEASEQSAATAGLATDADSRLIKANRYAFSLLAGTGEVLLDEMLFAGKEFFDRVVAETAIFNEFLARLAEAHSVRDYGAMCQECTKHQLDFIRRDMERVLKHSERAIDNTARLVETWRQNGASSSEQVRTQE